MVVALGLDVRPMRELLWNGVKGCDSFFGATKMTRNSAEVAWVGGWHSYLVKCPRRKNAPRYILSLGRDLVSAPPQQNEGRSFPERKSKTQLRDVPSLGATTTQ